MPTRLHVSFRLNMDNDNDILDNFGGRLVKDLNSALKLDDDNYDSNWARVYC